jgi:DNA polymerase-3 subunit epsilon
MQLQRCKGACIGKEPLALHQARLEAALAALQVKTWPYAGTIGLVEKSGDRTTEVHVVNNWCYLGTAKSDDALWRLLEEAPRRPAFDIDTYKILSKALSQRKLTVRLLSKIEGCTISEHGATQQ